jgi:hypothetical protein
MQTRFLHVASTLASTLVCSLSLIGCGGVGDVTTPASSSAQPGQATISGQPRNSVVIGQSYSFQPVIASGAGNLTFTARNLPSWLSLDGATGRLTGTPQESDIAMYSGISLVASDGSTLGPFSITVTASGSGRATVSWRPPTHNTDGSALTNLAGFVIAYGDSADDLSRSIAVDDPLATTYVVENLTNGTWYFAVQAINTEGAASFNSTLATKTIG